MLRTLLYDLYPSISPSAFLLNRVELPGIPAVDVVLQYDVADLVWIARCSDDGDAVRVQHWPDVKWFSGLLHALYSNMRISTIS